MIPRGKLSISFSNLFEALGYCFSKNSRHKFASNQLYYGNSVFCLSARTGLDLTLRSIDLDSTSEIIVSNVNIPDMFAIVQHHRLKIIPIGVQSDTLGVSINEVKAAITLNSKIILITHLFGAIVDMDPIIEIAKANQLIVIEDCAQAFDHHYRGHKETDVTLFSFGLIKTNTCLTGAMLCFNNTALYEKVTALNDQLPKQETKKYLAKILKGITIKIITIDWIYSLLYAATQLLGKDFDDFLSGLTKGFPGEDVVAKIQFQPCDANLRLLGKRINRAEHPQIAERIQIARKILAQIPNQHQIGKLAKQHSYWVLPIKSEHPDQLITKMRNIGIDATSKASSLVSLPLKKVNPDQLSLHQLVYLPIDSKLIVKIKNVFHEVDP